MAQATVSYTQMGKARKEESGYRYFVFKLQFFDGAATYGTGLALSKASLGCPSEIKSIMVSSANDGYLYKFDVPNMIMHIYQTPLVADGAAAAPLAELGAGVTPAAKTIYVEVVGY